MSESIFDAYDQEYSSVIQGATKAIGELRAAKPGSSGVSALIRHAEGTLSQTGDLIKQMEVEVRGQPGPTRKVLGEKVTEYKKALTNLRSDFERAKEQAQRSSLINEKSAADRQRLLDVNEKVARQSDLISGALRTVQETEQVGLEITSELQRNREKITSAGNKAQEFNVITDSARRTLSSMARRDVQQRMVIGFVALVLLIAIILVIYYTTNPPNNNSGNRLRG